MLTLNINYEVQADRVVTIRLPDTVHPGQHELVIVLEEEARPRVKLGSQAKILMQFAGTVAAFNSIDGVDFQREARSEWN